MFSTFSTRKKYSKYVSKRVPNELYRDFLRLGVPSCANLEACRAARRSLMRKYHPDRHANDPSFQKRATALAADINNSYQRIENWFVTGKVS